MGYDKILLNEQKRGVKTMNYYQRLKDVREDNDLKQINIANILNTTQKQYSRWETGDYQIPLDKMITLAKYYDISLDYLAGLTNDKRKYW